MLGISRPECISLLKNTLALGVLATVRKVRFLWPEALAVCVLIFSRASTTYIFL